MRERLDELWEGPPSPSTISVAQRTLYEQLAKSLEGKIDGVELDRALRSSAMLAVWAEAERSLKDKPEPAPEQLRSILEEIQTLDFARMLKNTLKEISRKLPPSPRGQRNTLKPPEQKAAIARVSELTRRRGLSRKRAYQEVAQNYSVHWRTIQNLVNRGIGKREAVGENRRT